MDAEGMDMERLLVMADDFTGALDTGVQFATYGARTEIITDVKVDFSEYPQAEVLVIDTETRHVSGDEAYETIYQLTQKAVETGIIHLYKKTDSDCGATYLMRLGRCWTLRGRISWLFCQRFQR